MDKRFYWSAIFVLLVLFTISLLGNFMFAKILIFPPPVEKKASFGEELIDGDPHSDRKVAVIDLKGVIAYEIQGASDESMVDDIIDELHQATEDDSVAAIVLDIDSPGGEVTASDVLYREIKRADHVKPVVAYISSIGASGAYYSSLGARYIMANELSLTASIGVIMQTVNYQKLADFIGLQTVTFKSGKMKDMLNPDRPMTEEEKAYVQGMIDETYNKFVGIVAKERKLNEADLRQGIADGRVISGKNALKDGLIDAVGYFDQALQKARKLAKLRSDAPAVRYMAPFSLGSLFRVFGKSTLKPEKVNIQIWPESLKLDMGKLYYLPPFLYSRH